jgi:hypothetical protein
MTNKKKKKGEELEGRMEDGDSKEGRISKKT